MKERNPITPKSYISFNRLKSKCERTNERTNRAKTKLFHFGTLAKLDQNKKRRAFYYTQNGSFLMSCGPDEAAACTTHHVSASPRIKSKQHQKALSNKNWNCLV